jgi:hypothetical protein
MKLNILHNKWVLGIIGILAAGNLGMLIHRREFDYCAILVISGAIASIFSRNMVVILLVAMVFTGLVKMSRASSSKFAEGFDPSVDSAADAITDASTDASTAPAAAVPDTAAIDPAATPAPTTAPKPDVLEPDAPPTTTEKKLDALQTELDTIQSKITDIKNKMQK